METKHIIEIGGAFNHIGSHPTRTWQVHIYINNQTAFIAIGATKEEVEENAKLIAAAPELLEALIQISESYKYCVKNAENSEFYINAINAINKATK